MSEKKGVFLGMALVCMALAFAVGFALAMFAVGGANILSRFALAWQLCGGALYLAAWTPAILLVSSALSMERSENGANFISAASRALVPALVLAGAVSIFYLLVVPGVRERKSWYENASALFHTSLADAKLQLENGRISEAQRLLLVCRSIDEHDSRYLIVWDQVQNAFVRASAVGLPEAPTAQEPQDPAWLSANRFYLESLKAQAEGRTFDAHYLAKRSVAIYPKRPEVLRLVEETWKALQVLGSGAEEAAQAAYYKRKLDAYARLQEGDYLEAYRLFSELSAENPSDADVVNYLSLSRNGLSNAAFFIEEYERAFRRSDRGEFSLHTEASGVRWTLHAQRLALSEDGVFFRDVELRSLGSTALDITAPFARLRGNTLLVRVVDADTPDLVWEAVYASGGPGPMGPHIVTLPFSEADVLDHVRLSGPAADIPLALLVSGMDLAKRFGLDTVALRTELGLRLAYPFVSLMLVLLGAGLGIRFRAKNAVRPIASYSSAPFLVALSVVPLQIATDAGRFAVSLTARLVPGAFILAWIGFLCACTAVAVLLAARVAVNAPR